jgi:hypothetical protein
VTGKLRWGHNGWGYGRRQMAQMQAQMANMSPDMMQTAMAQMKNMSASDMKAAQVHPPIARH